MMQTQPVADPADDVLVQNCSINYDGDFTGGYGGRVINIEDAGRNVRILDCQFTTVGETVPVGNVETTAIYLQSATFLEGDYENRTIRGCGFRGRTNSGLLRNMQAVFTLNMKNLTVEQCDLEQCDAGVTATIGAALTGRLDFQMSNCRVRDCAYALAFNFDIEGVGVRFTDNTVQDSSIFLSDNSSPITDVMVAGNTVINSIFILYATVLTDAKVDGNTFLVTAGRSEIEAPRIGRNHSSSSLIAASFTNNTVRGYNSLIDNDFVFGVAMQANNIRNITVRGNTFDNLQDSLIWTGAGNTDNTHNVIRILGNTASGPVVVDDNTFSDIGTGITDSGIGKQWMPWLIFMGNIDRDSTGCTFDSVSVCNNVVSACAVQLLYAHDMSMVSFTMNSNNFRYEASALGDWANDVNLDAITASGSYGPVSINNNIFKRVGESGIIIRSTGTVGVIDKVTMTGNIFDLGIASSAGDVIIQFAANMTYLIFRDNYCDIAVQELDLAATPPTDSTPTTPGSGAYPDNINIVRV